MSKKYLKFVLPVILAISLVIILVSVFKRDKRVSLPIINIARVDVNDTIVKENYTDIRIDLTGNTARNDNELLAKIKGRGHSSWNAVKKSYQMKLEKSDSLAGMPKAKKWLLLANYYDKTMLRNSLAFEIGKLSNQEHTPENVFFQINLDGEWQGVFQVSEKIELHKNRIPKDKGFLIEMDPAVRITPEDVAFKTRHYNFKIKEPDVEVDGAIFKEIHEYFIDVEQAFLNSSDQDFSTYKEYVDLENLVDWYIIHEIARNNDSNFYSSVYMTWKPGEKLKLGPIWDFDIGFGNINYGNNFEIEGFLFENNHWLKHIFEDPEFIALRKERYKHFYKNKSYLIEFLDDKAAFLNELATRNHEQYNLFNNKVWPNRVARGTYLEEVEDLKGWLSQRMDYLNEQFVINLETN